MEIDNKHSLTDAAVSRLWPSSPQVATNMGLLNGVMENSDTVATGVGESLPAVSGSVSLESAEANSSSSEPSSISIPKLSSESLSAQPLPGEEVCQCGAHNEGQAYHFRRLLLLHLQVIERQQGLLQVKDSEIDSLREDKEKLEVRLNRMERRLSVTGRRDNCASSSSSTTHQTSGQSTPFCSSTSEKRSEEKRPEERRSASESARRSRHHTPPAKRRLDRQSSQQLCLPPSRSSSPPPSSPATFSSGIRRKSPWHRPLFITTTDEYPVATPLWVEEMSLPVKKKDEAIVVPSWREVDLVTSTTATLRSLDKETESLDDEVFLRRHFKSEMDEKRIKRWDLQRSRTLRVHENLLRRYEEKEQKWRLTDASGEIRQEPTVLSTFMPSVEELVSVEITSELPVVAFGRPMPNFPQTEFSLPWFDVECREAEDDMRTTRSRSRSRHVD